MIRFSAVATALALTASLALSTPTSAETRAQSMRSAGHTAVATMHRTHKRAARHVAEWSERTLPGDVPFAGVRHDRAGNSYDYYRSGIGSPIAPELR